MGSSEGGRRTRPVTITDIARVTGVVPSTVSRALNKPGRVNAATRDRIQAAARELNYVPNSQARALISGRTGTIAVLISDVTNPFYFGLIRGTQQRLKAAGYAQLLIDTEDSGEHEAEMLHKMRRSLDGAILAASRLPEGALTTLAGEIPLVTVNRNVRGVQSVVIDTPTGIGLAVEHLVNLGHRDIVYVAGPDTAWSNRARWRSMCAAGERYGQRFRQVGPFPRGRSRIGSRRRGARRRGDRLRLLQRPVRHRHAAPAPGAGCTGPRRPQRGRLRRHLRRRLLPPAADHPDRADRAGR